MGITTVVNVRTECYEVFIGRPGPLGNPFVVGRDGTREECVQYHQEWLDGKREAPNGKRPPTRDYIVRMCKGKKLGCFCAPELCHGDNYVRICDGK